MLAVSAKIKDDASIIIIALVKFVSAKC